MLGAVVQLVPPAREEGHLDVDELLARVLPQLSEHRVEDVLDSAPTQIIACCGQSNKLDNDD